MTVGDAYITIATGLIDSEDFKDAWTGNILSPTLLTVLESEPTGYTSIVARMNEFVSGSFSLIEDPIDFYIGRTAILFEDDYTVLGISQADYVGE